MKSEAEKGGGGLALDFPPGLQATPLSPGSKPPFLVPFFGLLAEASRGFRGLVCAWRVASRAPAAGFEDKNPQAGEECKRRFRDITSAKDFLEAGQLRAREERGDKGADFGAGLGREGGLGGSAGFPDSGGREWSMFARRF